MCDALHLHGDGGRPASAQRQREEPVDERVQAGVEQAEQEEDVGERVGHGLLQTFRAEPVPQAQEVVGRPAHDEGADDHDAHLQRAHASLGDDVVVGAA